MKIIIKLIIIQQLARPISWIQYFIIVLSSYFINFEENCNLDNWMKGLFSLYFTISFEDFQNIENFTEWKEEKLFVFIDY